MSDGSLVHFSVGQRIPQLANGIDGCIMEMSESGLILHLLMNIPSAFELQEASVQAPFEIRFCPIHNIGFFTFQFGRLPWMDAPFSPNLYDRVHLPKLDEGTGLALTVVLVDTSVGEIKQIRIIGLGHDFSMQFLNWCRSVLQKEVSRTRYDDVIRVVNRQYSSDDLAAISSLRWKIVPIGLATDGGG